MNFLEFDDDPPFIPRTTRGNPVRQRDGLYDGNLFLKTRIPEPEKGCYFLTCAWCGKEDSWSFKSTSPCMWVPLAPDADPLELPLPDYVCDDCRYPVKVVVSIKGRVEYHEYLKSDHWKKVRENSLKRAGNKCQLCASKRLLEVHHNNYANLGYENPDDVIVLCHKCHGKHHGVEN